MTLCRATCYDFDPIGDRLPVKPNPEVSGIGLSSAFIIFIFECEEMCVLWLLNAL